MIQHRLKLQLLSPSFLGDAHQSGVWRTPPIKAMLREWWRVAAGPEHGHDYRLLRLREGKLFGNAWLDDDFSKSQVRMALEHWHAGKPGWDATDPRVSHPEVKDKNTGQARQVGSQLYLGYGPLMFQQGGTRPKNNAALQAGDSNTIDLAWPDEHDPVLRHTLQLIDWFGTIGGRSRNGWGSLSLGLDQQLSEQNPHLETVLRPLADCLRHDWPHAIGKDAAGALIWQSQTAFPNWPEAMRFLARIKIGFRTHLGFTSGKNSPRVEARHILAYPVTNHDVREWGGQARLANQLRFKLFPAENRQVRARLYHTPHKSPLPTGMSEAQEGAVWQQIHGWLDRQTDLTRPGVQV